MKKSFNRLFSMPMVTIVSFSVLINIFIELMSRSSLGSVLKYAVKTPFSFIFNTVIIMLTLSLALFFKRRIFATSLITLIWISLGIANFFMLNAGNTPLTIFHIANLGSAIKLSGLYMTVLEIALIILAVAAAVVGGIFLWKMAPKFIRNTKKAFLSVGLLCCACMFMGLRASAETPDFSDLSVAYEKYGFAYCFSYSVLNIGISIPENYSADTINRITTMLDIDNTEPTIKPNIIFVQLESFFDPKTLKDVSFSEDPVPNFTNLKKNYPSGYISVSSIGGGTANTEFEVMSGLSLSNFGIGEYPYLTLLSEKTCETIMRNLSEYGYTSTAIHSYTATFYNRHEVFKKLGFDRFVSEEFMNISERNELGWAKDTELLPYIEAALESTNTPDFIYTITVQSHGKYLTEEKKEQYPITSNTSVFSAKPQLDYYINQIKEVDDFIGSLVEKYETYEEPTVIVFFGDHLPALDIKAEDLYSEDLYKTEYVIWSNFQLDAEDKDIDAALLSSYVTSLLGMTNGTINKLNTYYSDDSDFLQISKNLAYDILYGKNFSKTQVYKQVDTENGLNLIHLDYFFFENDNLFVKGENFNEFSKICIDDTIRNDTEFIDSSTLKIKNFITFSDTTISVSQTANDGTVLGSTEMKICRRNNPIQKIIDDFNRKEK